MKKFILLFAVLSSYFVVHAQATVQSVAGVYQRNLINTTDNNIIYTLNLKADGTFEFHSYDKFQLGTPKNSRFNERNQYAKGSWKLDEKVVTFSTASTDFDEKFTLDFDTSKARFISKHPRDKSDKVVETALRFYESKIFWIEHLYILKID
ncbi:MAG: hypothetical protein WA749_12420 [Gelidibacter sp.]